MRWLRIVGLAAGCAIAGSGAAPAIDCPSRGGFAQVNESLFTATLQLAPAGPDRGSRTAARVESALPVTRAILFRPVLDPELEALGDRLPLRVSSLIRGAALWASPEIPWERDEGVRSLHFQGRVRDDVFRISLAPRHAVPAEPSAYSGRFSLEAASPVDDDGAPERVEADLTGRFRFDSFGAARVVDLLFEAPRRAFGDLSRPPDARRGAWSGHDDALRGRLARDVPRFLRAVERHVEITNLVDHREAPDGTRYVVLDAVGRIRPTALDPFPALQRFYDRVLRRARANVVFLDETDREWLRVSWDEGRVSLSGAIVDGALVPRFADDESPSKTDRLVPSDSGSGAYRTTSSLRVSALGIHAGLDGGAFRNEWRRDGETLAVATTMTRPPRIEATPVLEGLLRYAAGDFFAALGGERPLELRLASETLPGGDALNEVGLRAELLYAPALELLVRIADRFSDELALSVRADQRRLFDGLFAALEADFRAARPGLVALDRCFDLEDQTAG